MLVDMKRSKKNRDAELSAPCDPEEYHYGLRLELDDEVLKKLGIKKLPAVGEEYIVAGVGVVKSVNEHESDRSKSRNISIQLQKLDVGPLKEGDAVDAVSDAIKDV